ncbi:hypothetical protein ABT263_04840 [Kitasatospora sp. NPDC001603]|uniref:hypothetical protein n=1 Tax=Kitasatospora sp. NPDC001603 TaxID=3154388 RepID=UPI003324FCE7
MTADGPLTEEDLSAMERRAAAAAPGPWTAWLEGRHGVGGDSFIQVRPEAEPDDEIYVSRFVEGARLPGQDPRLDADIDFIAAARQDVPRLIAEVRRLRAAAADRSRGW